MCVTQAVQAPPKRTRRTRPDESSHLVGGGVVQRGDEVLITVDEDEEGAVERGSGWGTTRGARRRRGEEVGAALHEVVRDEAIQLLAHLHTHQHHKKADGDRS